MDDHDCCTAMGNKHCENSVNEFGQIGCVSRYAVRPPRLFHGDTALCRRAVYVKQHIGTVEHCRVSPGCLKKYFCSWTVFDDTCTAKNAALNGHHRGFGLTLT